MIFTKIISKNFSWNDLNNNCHINDSIFIDPVNPSEISDLIWKTPDISLFYNNSLSYLIFKQTLTLSQLHFLLFLNRSLISEKFPSSYKKKLLLYLFKSGDHKQCGNYRPITLTWTVSKILKKCIKSRIMSFLNKHNFFSSYQFGFRSNMSTVDPLTKTSHFIHNNLDNKFKI